MTVPDNPGRYGNFRVLALETKIKRWAQNCENLANTVDDNGEYPALLVVTEDGLLEMPLRDVFAGMAAAMRSELPESDKP